MLFFPTTSSNKCKLDVLSFKKFMFFSRLSINISISNYTNILYFSLLKNIYYNNCNYSLFITRSLILKFFLKVTSCNYTFTQVNNSLKSIYYPYH